MYDSQDQILALDFLFLVRGANGGEAHMHSPPVSLRAMPARSDCLTRAILARERVWHVSTCTYMLADIRGRRSHAQPPRQPARHAECPCLDRSVLSMPRAEIQGQNLVLTVLHVLDCLTRGLTVLHLVLTVLYSLDSRGAKLTCTAPRSARAPC